MLIEVKDEVYIAVEIDIEYKIKFIWKMSFG